MTETKHQIRWFVRAGDELIPFESTMRGSWPFEARCSCGWETRLGGGTRSAIRRMIVEHKADADFEATHEWTGREWVARR